MTIETKVEKMAANTKVCTFEWPGLYVVSQKKGPVSHDVSKMLENCCQDLQVTANQGDLSKYSGLYHPSNVETTNKGKNIGGSVVHLMCQNTTSLL